MKSRILFVGAFEELRVSLDQMYCQWEMEFSDNGPSAVETLAQSSFDVVVADAEIPDTDGAKLLHEIREQHPQTVRMMLLGGNAEDAFAQSVAPAHQFLPKPCDAEFLEAKVTRALALRRILVNEALTSCIAKMKSLPSPPTLYFDIMKELASGGEKTMTRVGELISQDIGMTAKLLQLVNSVHFGLKVRASNPVHAAKMLGPTTVRALVLTSEVFSQFGQTRLPGMSFQRLLEHSQLVSSFAKKIMTVEGQGKSMSEDAFLAGVLHDTGKLVLASNFPEEYSQAGKLAVENDLPLWQAEREILGATHAEMGAYLVGLWGIADPIVEALAFHHQPATSFEVQFGLLTAIHVADVFEHELQAQDDVMQTSALDEDYLAELNLLDRLSVWRQSCLEALPKKN